jgi:hypothetical protein
VWQAWFGRGPSGLTVPIYVSVESTLDGLVRLDAEDELLDAGLWPDDYPLRVLQRRRRLGSDAQLAESNQQGSRRCSN